MCVCVWGGVSAQYPSGAQRHTELLWLLRPHDLGAHVQEHCLQLLGFCALGQLAFPRMGRSPESPQEPQEQLPEGKKEVEGVCPTWGWPHVEPTMVQSSAPALLPTRTIKP